MKRPIFCLAGLLFFTTAFSQKLYFIYLQSETEQPFFVRMNEKVFSSTSSGYLILSKLHDSTYTIRVGFPENKWPEQVFTVKPGARDRGFLLKNFPEKGWGLFDLQTSSTIMAEQGNQSAKTELKEVSLFTEVLAKAANDPSLREKTVSLQPAIVREEVKNKEKDPGLVQAIKTEPVKKEEPPVVIKEKEIAVTIGEPVVKKELAEKKEEPPVPVEEKKAGLKTTEAVAKTDDPVKKEELPVALKEKQTAIAAQTVKVDSSAKEENPVLMRAEAISEKKERPVGPTEEYKPSVVRRRSESSTTEGFGLTFVDEYADGKKDTIRIIIPNPRYTYSSVAKEQLKDEKKFLDITTETKDDALISKANVADTAVKKNVKVITCTSVAAESDFLKLRKRMAGENNDAGMLGEAAKYFKSKCFSVLQLKNLSTLFLNDEGKYRFFDAAYTAVLDRENFSTLAGELKEEQYLKQFRALMP